MEMPKEMGIVKRKDQRIARAVLAGLAAGSMTGVLGIGVGRGEGSGCRYGG